ncbi:MAG: nuclear transport factor 2 family protein [Armatimonadota bacterium]|nr:nuclear transport factor 2 family protein [Armatimonadota bacterium]
MPNVALPPPIERYFAAKEGEDAEETLACFTEDATVWDNGEDLELKGIAQIREWMTGTVAGYKLSSEVKSGEMRGEEFVAGVVVSGDFPGSPYEFAYRFKLRGDRIAELAIDPIGSLAP